MRLRSGISVQFRRKFFRIFSDDVKGPRSKNSTLVIIIATISVRKQTVQQRWTQESRLRSQCYFKEVQLEYCHVRRLLNSILRQSRPPSGSTPLLQVSKNCSGSIPGGSMMNWRRFLNKYVLQHHGFKKLNFRLSVLGNSRHANVYMYFLVLRILCYRQ